MARSIVLHMGFINTPYSKQAKIAPMAFAKAHEAKRKRAVTGRLGAQQVAGILESKYNVVEIFNHVHDEDIKEILTEAFRDVTIKSFSEKKKFASERMVQFMKPKTEEIEKLFRQYLDREETGVDVAAATKGNRSGRKSKTPRQPFIDTGVYRASFRCWADIK
jgi:hypothetical protein